MLLTLWNQIQAFLGLGLDVGNVNSPQMALRTILIYLFTLAIVRLGSKRFLAEQTAFDVIIGIMLGSIMSRAINGSAPFVPTLVSGIILVGVHWLLGILSYRIHWFGPIVKGNPVSLIKDGEPQEKQFAETAISKNDLEQALRLQAKEMDLSKVKFAYLERNGRISIVPYPSQPHLLEVGVKDGVQTVRIELE